MDTELLTDRYLLLCWAFAGVPALLSVTLAPWLMGRSARKRGFFAGGAPRRIARCLFLSSGISIGLCLLLGQSHPGFLLPGLGGAVLFFASLWGLPRRAFWGPHIGMILLCNLMYLGAFSAGLGRVRLLGMRSIDLVRLKIIGNELLAYREDHGVFPEDLRHLVDADRLSPDLLLPIFADTPREYPQSRPYSGPCEFSYIPLPDDAPEGLVWLWESPKYHRGEGAWVHYTWLEMQWVTPERLREDLERTEAWVRARQRSPGTAPAATFPSSKENRQPRSQTTSAGAPAADI